MIKSAPARLIAVRISITMRCSSIQVFAAAAFTIECSPETLYATRGKSKRVRFGNAIEICERGFHHIQIGTFKDVEFGFA